MFEAMRVVEDAAGVVEKAEGIIDSSGMRLALSRTKLGNEAPMGTRVTLGCAGALVGLVEAVDAPYGAGDCRACRSI